MKKARRYLKQRRSRDDKTGLLPKEEEFCQYYVQLKIGEKAAIKAGYSPDTAASQASQILNRLNVRLRIRELLEEQFKRVKLDSDFVLKGLMKVAYADLAEAYDDNGSLKPIAEMPEHLRKALAGVETDDLFDGEGINRKLMGYTRKIKLCDRNKALQDLGRHFKLFTDVQEVRGLEGLAAKMEAAAKRRIECQKQKNSPKSK